MSHWMCDDMSPVLPLRDVRPVCNGRPTEPKGDHSLVSKKGSNYFLGIDPNTILFFSLLLYIYLHSMIALNVLHTYLFSFDDCSERTIYLSIYLSFFFLFFSILFFDKIYLLSFQCIGVPIKPIMYTPRVKYILILTLPST